MRSADLYLLCLVILVVGFASAGVIYAFAEDGEESAAMQEMSISKQYVRQLQQFGGKASVVFDDLQRWFASLWRGRRLAGTVAGFTALAALPVFVAARIRARREKLRS